MKASRFYSQVRLMLRCIAPIAQESCFALKGGTAINLFIRNLPRLSVDIDLTYVPLDSRDVALENISSSLQRIAATITKTIPGAKVLEAKARGQEKRTTKLLVSFDGQTVKIEPNEVLRGTVFGVEQRKIVSKAEDLFELTAKIATLNIADIYGGKLCAALDRQHPRDLYDVKILMDNGGITNDIRKAFVVYLASHDRPINELIDPPKKDITRIYETDFVDMTEEPVTLADLLAAREQYILHLKNDLTQAERQFLLSVKQGEPDWNLLGIAGIERLPALQWKLTNVLKMKTANKEKHRVAFERLKIKLGM